MTVDLDMFNVANEYMDEKIGQSKQGVRSQTANQMFIMYSNLPGNTEGILKKDILLKMEQIEKKILRHPDYGTHCLAASQYNSSCNDIAY